MSSYKPENYPSVSPYFTGANPGAAIDFLIAVFDAVEGGRFADTMADEITLKFASTTRLSCWATRREGGQRITY